MKLNDAITVFRRVLREAEALAPWAIHVVGVPLTVGGLLFRCGTAHEQQKKERVPHVFSHE